MNTYNRIVVEQYCRESSLSSHQKEILIQKLEEKYGTRLETEDLLSIDTKVTSVPGRLIGAKQEENSVKDRRE
jgi:hypothetical protein